MISIDQLRSFVGSGAISISSSGGAQGAPAIRNTGVLHAIKTFFGFESAKAVNRATVEAVREAINNDPKLFVGRNRANELLNAVRGTITIEKVKDIISSVTATVEGMNASQLRQSVGKVIAARVEARPRSEWPKWAQKTLDTEDQIKEWAKLTAATIVDRGEPKGGWGSLNIAAAVAEVDETLSAAFAEVPDQTMFAKMVFDRGTCVLHKSSGGSLKPREECVKIARQAKSLFDAAGGLVSWSQVGDSRYTTVSHIARWCISQMSDLFPAELFTKMAKAGLELKPNPLDDIYEGTSIDVIKQKMKDFKSAVEKAMYKVLEEDKEAEEMVKNGGGQVRFELQNLVVCMAVTRYDWPLPGLRFGLNQVEAQDFMDKGAPTSPEEFSVQSMMQMVDQTLAEMGLRRDYHG